MNNKEVREKAISLLSRRSHSAKELRKKLLKRNYSRSKINQVIQGLKESGYLDDEKFAEQWIKNRIEKKPRGKALIKSELLQKGVDRRIIEEKLNSLLPTSREKEMAQHLADKWLNKKRGKEENIKEKLYRYLNNKGFDREIIREIINYDNH